MANLITPIATLSYPNLAKPQPAQKPGDKEKFSASLVFEKGADVTAMRNAVVEAAIEKFGSEIALPGNKKMKTADAIAKGILKSPFRDDGEAKGYPEGSVFFNARTEKKPGCVYNWADPTTGKPAPIPADKVEEVLYPGCKVRASVTFYGFDTAGNKGVAVALNNVQKIGEGDRLDGRKAAEDEFTADLSEAPVGLESLQ